MSVDQGHVRIRARFRTESGSADLAGTLELLAQFRSYLQVHIWLKLDPSVVIGGDMRGRIGHEAAMLFRVASSRTSQVFIERLGPDPLEVDLRLSPVAMPAREIAVNMIDTWARFSDTERDFLGADAVMGLNTIQQAVEQRGWKLPEPPDKEMGQTLSEALVVLLALDSLEWLEA